MSSAEARRPYWRQRASGRMRWWRARQWHTPKLQQEWVVFHDDGSTELEWRDVPQVTE